MTDGIFVRRQFRRAPAGLHVVGRSSAGEARHLEMPGQPRRQRIKIVRRLPAQFFQGAADSLVEVRSLHRIQLIVEVTLKKVMPETIT